MAVIKEEEQATNDLLENDERIKSLQILLISRTSYHNAEASKLLSHEKTPKKLKWQSK